jgi:hypothetical protein
MAALGSDLPGNQLKAMDNSGLNYLATLVKYLRDEDIVRAYDSGFETFEFKAGHPVHSAAMQRLRTQIANMHSSQSLVVQSSMSQDLARVDPEGPIVAQLRADGSISCMYSLGDHKWVGF